jgi:hypothetical protein
MRSMAEQIENESGLQAPKDGAGALLITQCTDVLLLTWTNHGSVLEAQIDQFNPRSDVIQSLACSGNVCFRSLCSEFRAPCSPVVAQMGKMATIAATLVCLYSTLCEVFHLNGHSNQRHRVPRITFARHCVRIIVRKTLRPFSSHLAIAHHVPVQARRLAATHGFIA